MDARAIKEPSEQRGRMRARVWIALAVVVHGLLLFFAIPVLGPSLKISYGEEKYADGYDLLADNLNAGHGYRFYPDTALTLMREPGYPLFLAALRKAFGDSIVAVKAANMLLALLASGCMIVLAKRIFADLQIGQPSLTLIAPLLYLFSPGLLMAESRGGLELLFSFLLTLFVLVVYEAVRTTRLLFFAAAGGVLGVTVLVRSTPMLFPAFLLVYLLVVERKRLSPLAAIRNVAVMVCLMVACLSPWIVRNYRLTGKFVPTASVFGVSAQAGQYINTHLFEGRPYWLLDREASRERDKIAAALGMPFEDGAEGYYQTFYRSEDEIRFSSVLAQQVVEQYKQSPLLMIRCFSQNVLGFWFAGKSWGVMAVNLIVQAPYIILGAIGIVFCAKAHRLRSVGLLILFIGYVWAVHVPILAQARYSIPLLSLVSCLGAVGIIALGKSAKASSKTQQASLAASR